MESRVETESLRARAILGFWAPLAGTWWMMALEGVILSAILARLPDPKANLAAYGVAFAFAILVEAPVILLMSASTALSRDRASHEALWKFSFRLILIITVLMLVLVLPPVWNAMGRLLHLDSHVAALVHGALLFLIPWPGAIGDRRYHQGLLIRGHRTSRVVQATVLRVVAMLTTALLAARFTSLPGASVGGLALSAGVVSEALAVRWMARPELAALRRQSLEDCEPSPSQREVFDFYLPLALTSVLALAAQPVITFFVGRAPAALESLAVLPVIHGLTFLFRALALSYQEVVIALLGEEGEHFRALGRFALGLLVAVGVLMVGIAFTPLGEIWMRRVAGLSPELADFALDALRIFAFLPMLSVLQSFLRAILVQVRSTSRVGWGTGVEVLTIAIVLAVTIGPLHFVGAVAAGTAVIAGRLVGLFVLWPPSRVAIDGFLGRRRSAGAAPAQSL